MRTKDLSVIVPIYNTPINALERCLQSMLSLGTVDYEVLLIDDGSKESIGAFCKEYIVEKKGNWYEDRCFDVYL